MTRKDYVNLAEALRRSYTLAPVAGGIDAESWKRGVYDAVLQVSTVLAQDNPRFDRARFLAAAGVKP